MHPAFKSQALHLSCCLSQARPHRLCACAGNSCRFPQSCQHSDFSSEIVATSSAKYATSWYETQQDAVVPVAGRHSAFGQEGCGVPVGMSHGLACTLSFGLPCRGGCLEFVLHWRLSRGRLQGGNACACVCHVQVGCTSRCSCRRLLVLAAPAADGSGQLSLLSEGLGVLSAVVSASDCFWCCRLVQGLLQMLVVQNSTMNVGHWARAGCRCTHVYWLCLQP